MDQPDSVLIRQQQCNLNKVIDAEVLSISSNSSICSDFCGFKELQDIEMSLKQKTKYLNDIQEFDVDPKPNIESKTNVKQGPAVSAANEAKKRFFVSEMELLPAEEIFEVNSNSTTDTLRRQRLERNKELRLKETFLISRNPIKKLSKNTFQKMRADDNSESSSEFPASSPSNTQLQKKPQQSQRPPLLKNTLPADAFERGLALIAVQNPPMTVNDKIAAWQCETIDKLSDVEDVTNFDETFRLRIGSTRRLPIRSKQAIAGETYTTFAEFHKRITDIRAPETNLRGNDSKQKSKFTSEDDEKPTTSNSMARTRDTPLKKRPSKYKRAAEAINDVNIPKKKSSSSGTPKHEMSSINKKKAQQSKIAAATAAGDDAAAAATTAVKICAEESSAATSSHAYTKDNSKSSRQIKAKQAKIVETTTATAINANLRNQIGLTTTPTKEEQDAFFRWRRLSREIDKSLTQSSVKPKLESNHSENTGIIQIRYDFHQKLPPEQASTKSNAYNVVVKNLKIENEKNNDFQNDSGNFKIPIEPQKLKEIQSNALTDIKLDSNFETREKSEIMPKDEMSLNDANKKNKSVADDEDEDDGKCNKNPNMLLDFSVEFHQQHEFCNYLGLTGMSTANAMANAAEELSKCNIARRSLRVRKKEIQKAKVVSKQKTIPKKIERNEHTSGLLQFNQQQPTISASNIMKIDKSKESSKSKIMENGSLASCAENLETKTTTNLAIANDKLNIGNLTPSEQLMQHTKEKEAKIQILCQITASSKREEEEACKKCVEQITEPIRRTLMEQCKLNGGDGAKPATSKPKLETNAAKQLLPVKSTELPMISTPSSPPQPSLLASNQTKPLLIETNNSVVEITKFIELTPKKSNDKLEENCKAEVQTLHQKVQRCLEESRQNPPNIFIVKSMDSLKDNKVVDANTEKPQTLENVAELGLEEQEVAYEDESVGNEKPLRTLRAKANVRNNKATQVSTAEAEAAAASAAAKGKKRKSTRTNGGSIRKSNSNLSGTRRLYTRSMLNLNQQRELRNRKVILKLLKTYSGLRIKVSPPKKKAASATKASDTTKNISSAVAAANNKKNRNSSATATAPETALELPVSSEASTIGDKKSSPLTTLFVNKITDSSSKNAVKDSCSNSQAQIQSSNTSAGELCSTNYDSLVDTTNDLTDEKHNQSNSQTKAAAAVFEYENLFAGESENMIAASSRTLTPKCMLSGDILKPFNDAKDKFTDASVQTDLANVTTILQPLSLDNINDAVVPAFLSAAATAPATQPTCTKTRDTNEMDVVSSSDIVTSTTTHIGEHNRSALNHHHNSSKSNLVTKELYRNFSFTAESNVAADAAPSQTSTATDLFAEMNPLANISLNSSALNINELGIHALSEPSRALRNPLKTSDGPVLYMFYEDNLLIVVQEALISFWKYSRILNALTVKLLHDAKLASSCNSRDLNTDELQSSAATMGFRSSDLEDMSSTLLSGCEWFYLGERKRLTNDMEIESPYMNRLCFNDSRPVYVEMRCRELLNDFRECNLLSCYVNIYFFNEEEQVPSFHSVQLDTIQSAPNDVIYTTIFDSRYFVLAWPQANVLGKVRSGVCKYALTPELDMLATTRDFKAMRHALRSLECLKDGKLLGFGDSQLTVWDHRSGDVLMNYDLSMPLGRNLGTIYYQGLEEGQDNVVIMLQHVRSEASSDLVVIACTISHTNPSRRVLQRHRLPTPAFYNIKRGVNNGEHFVITAETDEEIWINCNDPRQLIFIPAQRSQRFYSANRTTLVELTHQTLTVDSFSNYLLKIAAGISSSKKKLTLKTVAPFPNNDDNDNDNKTTNWMY